MVNIKNKTKNKKYQKQGFSLVEIILSLGLVSMLALTVSSIIRYADQGQIELNQERTVREITRYIELQLSNNLICNNTFHNIDLGTTITHLKNQSGPLTEVVVGNKYRHESKDGIMDGIVVTTDEHAVLLKDMKITHNTSSEHPLSYHYHEQTPGIVIQTEDVKMVNAQLKITFELKSRTSNQGVARERPMGLSLRLVIKDSKIVSCHNEADFYQTSCTAIGGSFNLTSGKCEKSFMEICFDGTCQTRWPHVKISNTCTTRALATGCNSNESAIYINFSTSQIRCCETSKFQDGQ